MVLFLLKAFSLNFIRSIQGAKRQSNLNNKKILPENVEKGFIQVRLGIS